jgi:starvation-inducible DNA-binding protein
MKALHSTSAEAPKMYETENDNSLQRRTQLNAMLNQRLASAVDLQMQMKQAHWNVKGPSFIGLHELFDKAAEAVEGYVGQITERIVQLGGVARALSTFGQEARNTISEADELDDADTADLFTEISRGVDKWLWFVEAHSQAAK